MTSLLRGRRDNLCHREVAAAFKLASLNTYLLATNRQALRNAFDNERHSEVLANGSVVMQMHFLTYAIQL